MKDELIYANSGARIKKRREELGMTLEEVGKRLGHNKSTIKRYEDGITKRITIATYERLAKILETSPLYLMGGDCDNINENDEKITSFKESESSACVMYAIPILGYVRAGEPISANQEILGTTYVEKKDFKDYFALKVKGDSMDLANIKDGSVVIVHKQDYIENGEIGVVLVDNEDATVKRVYINDNNALLSPQSSNPENQPIFVDLKSRNFKILGKVIKVEYYV